MSGIRELKKSKCTIILVKLSGSEYISVDYMNIIEECMRFICTIQVKKECRDFFEDKTDALISKIDYYPSKPKRKMIRYGTLLFNH